MTIESADRKTDSRTVIVVGGGVSGCACAARLAGHGVWVTVVSSALDVVGLPGYGPVVEAGRSGWAELVDVFECLPEQLRRAWLDTAAVPVSGEPLLVIDRRAVSVETKRALEKIPGLEFRQALVTDVRVRTDCRVEVESAFGEVFVADAVVIASGLALQGRVEVGEEVLPGGRYGEVPADELFRSLSELGVRFEETVVDIGPRYARDASEMLSVVGSVGEPGKDMEAGRAGEMWADEAGEGLVRRELAPWLDVKDGLAVDRGTGATDHGPCATDRETGGRPWPSDFPPAPYWSGELRSAAAILRMCGERDGEHASDSAGRSAMKATRESPQACRQRALGVVVPDGVATAEYYVSLMQAGGGEGLTRMGHRVRALVASGVDEVGRVRGVTGHLRFVGRSAGADTYLASLRSGILVADSAAIDVELEGDSK